MAIIRGHHDFDDHFTRIPNDWLRDNRLSLEARGLMGQIMSHRPGWNMSLRSLAYANSVGRDRIKRIIDELIEAGYLERSEKQGKDDKGRMQSFDYTTKSPEWTQKWTQNPDTDNPSTDKPDTEDRSTKKTIPIEEQDSKKTIDIEREFDRFWSVYPVKRDKRKAKTAFESAVKRANPDDIIAGAERYRDDPNREESYTKYPQGWLSADAWENPPELPRGRKLTNAEQAAQLAMKYRAQAQQEQMAIEADDDIIDITEVSEIATDWMKGVDDV